MSKPALIIMAQDGYQDQEYQGTKNGLLGEGFSIVIASKEIGSCSGKLGGEEQATIAMRDVKVTDYNRIAFIGGPGARALRDDEDAHKIAEDTADEDLPLGAICIAPTILASAGVLDGKRCTVWNNDKLQGKYLVDHGAIYTGEAVVTDGYIITADGPDSAEEFGRRLASL